MLILIVGLAIALALPAVQTSLAHFATGKINEKFDIKTNISTVSIDLSGTVRLGNVWIKDDRDSILIKIDDLQTNILDVNSLVGGQLFFGNTSIHNLDFHIATYQNDSVSNLDKFIAVFDNGSEGEGNFLMHINQINVSNGNFSVKDYNKPNPESVDFTGINGEVEGLHIKGSHIQAKVKGLDLVGFGGLSLENSATDFAMDKTYMKFHNLLLKTNATTLKGRLDMTYREGGLTNFTEDVNLLLEVEPSKLSTNDIKYFYDGIGANQTLYLQTIAKGTLNDFVLANTIFSDQAGAQVIGQFKFNKLLKGNDNLKVTTNLDRLFISRDRAVALLPDALGSALPEELSKVGWLNLTGSLTYSNFSLNADINALSQIGYAETNIELAKINQKDQATYRGNIILDDFDLGQISGQEQLGKTTIDLFVDGKSFDPQKLQTIVTGQIFALTFNGYTYQNILVDGNLKMPKYQGYLSSKDPNAQLNFDGEIDFTSKPNEYNFVADVSHLNLAALGFVKDSISNFKGQLEVNAKGTNIDDFEGKALLKNAVFTNSNDTYQFANFEVESQFMDNDSRLISFHSEDIADGYINGKFKVNQLPSIVENALGSLYTNYSPIELEDNQYVDFKFVINDKIVNLFAPQIQISEETQIEGKINADEGDFKLNFTTPFVNVSGNRLANIDLQVDNQNPLYNAYIAIDSVSLKGYDITDFNFINVTQNDTLFARTEFVGGAEKEDFYNLNLYYTIDEENRSIVGFNKSEVNFKQFMWYINEEENDQNKVVFNKEITDFDIQNLTLSHEGQTVVLDGGMKGKDYKDLLLTLNQVDLNKITPSIDGLTFKGLMNGEARLFQENDVFDPSTDINISGLVINEVDLGQFNLSVQGNETLRHFDIQSSIINEGKKMFYIDGGLRFFRNNSRLNAEVGFDKFDMKVIAPFLQSIFSDLRGNATGVLQVRGSHKAPKVDGTLYMNDAGMKPVFTGVDYAFAPETELQVTEKSFTLNQQKMIDTKNKTEGTINGSITHHNFQNWALDLSINSDNLMVLDLEHEEEVPYYGTAFIQGGATLKGPAESMNIAVQARSKPGTKIKIPLDETGGIGDNNFIHFISEEEKKQREQGIFEPIENVQTGGIQLDFDLGITPDADIEVIIDQKTGHGMKGKGAGYIKMAINTLGRFNMWGNFEVNEGEYNFRTNAAVIPIDKKLSVKKGGTIIWDGDPMNANLNLEAIYHTQANPGLIVESSMVNKKIDTDVSVVVTGNLSNPEINFLIDFPNVSSTIKSEIEYALADNDLRRTQALALLGTGNFISPKNASTAAYGSLFESMGSLFDGIFSEEGGKVQVSLDYTQAERNPFAENESARISANISTQLSDRIVLNGKLGVPVGGEDNAIVGDVEIQFLLNQDGSLRAQVFNRENNITYLGEGIGYTQGVGLAYEVDFNSFRELWQKIFLKAEERARRERQRLEEEEKKKQEQLPQQNDTIEQIEYSEKRIENNHQNALYHTETDK
ncbi:MAG TPA: translocation/assembly module TamB domain-containing protein [Flavobacterium sp.]|nr:translocation/assembly module TamB domain-containing protein [Flavobacterium sp.]